jgi:uncharacterized SAM-binding protein YcdF (DUF218 family)
VIRGKRFVVVAAVVVGLAAVWAARVYWLPAAARWLDVGGAPARVDYVFVLPGDENIRPFVAAALVKAGLAERALVPKNSVVPAVIDGLRPPAHEVIRQVLLQRGVPEEKITLLEGKTASTQDDILVLARFFHDHPAAHVAIVTSGYHTRRTRLIARRLLPGRQAQLWFVSAPVDTFRIDTWWRSELGFLAITSEYAKLTATHARTRQAIVLAALTVILLVIAACRRRSEVRGQT